MAGEGHQPNRLVGTAFDLELEYVVVPVQSQKEEPENHGSSFYLWHIPHCLPAKNLHVNQGVQMAKVGTTILSEDPKKVPQLQKLMPSQKV